MSTDDRNTETEEIILDDVDLSNCLQHFTALEEIKEKLVRFFRFSTLCEMK